MEAKLNKPVSRAVALTPLAAYKKGTITLRSYGKDSYVTYIRPVSAAGVKKFGKELAIHVDGQSVVCNARMIRTLKKVLKAAGELG